MCNYDPLYTLIPHQHCLKFDKRTHNLYLATTAHTQTQPAHATFLNRRHHHLHIPSMLNQQLKSCARELDVRPDSNEPFQSAFPRARLAALHHNHTRTPNLIHQACHYISTYGIHHRDADQLIITNTLQTLLHHTDSSPLLGIPPQNNTILNPSPFNIIGDGPTHLPLTHRQHLHNSLTKLISTQTTHPADIAVDHRHLPHLNTHTTITTALTQAHCLYLTDIDMYLTFAE